MPFKEGGEFVGLFLIGNFSLFFIIRSRVPWGGFANLSGASGDLKFTICRMEGHTDLLPTASTWFDLFYLSLFARETVWAVITQKHFWILVLFCNCIYLASIRSLSLLFCWMILLISNNITKHAFWNPMYWQNSLSIVQGLSNKNQVHYKWLSIVQGLLNKNQYLIKCKISCLTTHVIWNDETTDTIHARDAWVSKTKNDSNFLKLVINFY